jgi:hypothetical protein
MELVPGGYTSRLQVMDVGLNKPFKDRVRDQYDEWFMTVPSGSKPQRSKATCEVDSVFVVSYFHSLLRQHALDQAYCLIRTVATTFSCLAETVNMIHLN